MPVISDIVTTARASAARYFDANGVMQTAADNEWRRDHDPITRQPRGALIEGQATNLVFPSETFAASTGMLSVSKTAAAPDGTANATILTEASTTGEHYADDKSVPVLEGEYLTWSYFVKKSPTGASRNAYVRMAGGLVAVSFFDPNNGAWVGAGSGAGFVSRGFEVLSNGWYRVWVTGLVTANGSAICRLQLAAGTTTSYAGDGVSGLIVFGRQAEKAAAPSSYIPTTTAAATRAADNPMASGLSAVFGDQYTIAVRYRLRALTPGNKSAFEATGASSNSTDIVHVGSSGSRTWRNKTDGVDQVDIAIVAVTAMTRQSVALSYATGRFAYSANGSPVSARASGTPPKLLDTLRVGSTAGTWHLNGWLEQFSVFPRVLSDSELQAITVLP